MNCNKTKYARKKKEKEKKCTRQSNLKKKKKKKKHCARQSNWRSKKQANKNTVQDNPMNDWIENNFSIKNKNNPALYAVYK